MANTSIPELTTADHIELRAGVILHVVSSTRLQSMGYIELQAGARMLKYRSPAEERLKQVEGESQVAVFDPEAGPQIHHLTRGSELRLLVGSEHEHSNPHAHTSLTRWEYEGDATELIRLWRKH